MASNSNRFKSRHIDSPFFRKSFIIVLLIASLPISLLSVVTYMVGTSQIEREVDRTQQLRLGYSADKLNEQLKQLENMVTMWTFNPIFQANLGDISSDSFHREVVLVQNLAKTLLIMSSSSPLIREVRLHLPDTSVYMTSLNNQVVIPVTNPEENDFFRSLFVKEIDNYWTYSQGYLSFVQMVPNRSPYGYLLAHIDAAAVNELVRMDTELQGTSFILKQNGDWLDPNVAKEADKHRLDYYLRDELNRQGGEQGSFFSTWDGEKYAVTYRTIERTGWMYVSATPTSKLTQPIVNTSRIILSAGCLGIAISAALSWFASHKLSQPIVRLVELFRAGKSGASVMHSGDEVDYIERQWQFINNESQMLHERMERHLETFKELFLFQLLNDHLSHLQEHDLKGRMEQYGWEVEGKKFGLLVMRLSGFSKLRERFSEGDEQLVTFAAANVVGEIARSQFEQVEITITEDFYVAVIVMLPAELALEETLKRLCGYGEQAVQSLSAVLHLHVLVGVAKPAVRLVELPRVYEEVIRSFRHRKLQHVNQVLVMGQLPILDMSAAYPFAAEKEIVRSMRAGDKEEMMAALTNFAKALETGGETELAVRQGMNQLLGVVLHHMLLSGYNPAALYRGTDLYEELARLQEPEEMQDWISDKISVFLQAIEETTNQTQTNYMNETIDKVVELLEQDYAQDISLEMYADRFGISMSKLSAGFKESTGINFIDYLTRLRLEKSKELLLHSFEKVNDIAYSVGYQPSYYYRVFKKHEGITPSQYRGRYK